MLSVFPHDLWYVRRARKFADEIYSCAGGFWGDKGYIRMIRGSTPNAAGQCGIAMQPSYPKKNSPNPPAPKPTPPGPPPTPPPPSPNVCDTSTECPAGNNLFEHQGWPFLFFVQRNTEVALKAIYLRPGAMRWAFCKCIKCNSLASC